MGEVDVGILGQIASASIFRDGAAPIGIRDKVLVLKESLEHILTATLSGKMVFPDVPHHGVQKDPRQLVEEHHVHDVKCAVVEA